MDILEQIVVQRRLDIDAAKLSIPVSELERRVSTCYDEPPISLYRSITSSRRMVVAAEFKRASPSKGDIAVAGAAADNYAECYTRGGADIISILTEPHWFHGSLSDLESARACSRTVAHRLDMSPPALLRKDFVIDEYQILEARAYGADTVLLIVSLLPTVDALTPFIKYSRRLGMEPLVEVNTIEEAEVALAAGSKVIGVNNRNLRTFTVDMGTTTQVVSHIASSTQFMGAPHSSPVVLSLSGIRVAADITSLIDGCTKAASRLPAATISKVLRGFLIGEALMRSPMPEAMVRELTTASSMQAGQSSGCVRYRTLSKVCGLCDGDSALLACRFGCDFVGFVMVPGSPRYIAPDRARTIVDRICAFRECSPRMSLMEAVSCRTAGSLRSLEGSYHKIADAAMRARPLCVGVFMNQSVGDVLDAVGAANIDMIQLHGNESPSDWADTSFPIIKVIHIPTDCLSEADLVSAATALISWAGIACAIIFDSKAGHSPAGGTGIPFDHSSVFCGIEAQLAHLCETIDGVSIPIIVGGGLTPENVPCVLQLTDRDRRPAHSRGPTLCVVGVDASSGIESADGPKGIKHAQKLESFLRAVAKSTVSS